MSHQNTPRSYNKTPGSISNEAHPNFGVNNNVPNQKPVMDSSMCVSDLQASNPRQLLNAYVYDFLIKSRLPQTAKIFVNEAEVPSVRSNNFKKSPQNPNNNPNTPSTPKNLQQMQKDNNLPNLSMAMDAPQGFLFEWWQVFWDVFQAKTNRGSSNFASQYYQMQILKQRQQHELQGLNVNPVGVPTASQFPGQLQPHQMPPHANMDQQIHQHGQIPQHQWSVQPSQAPQAPQPPHGQQNIQQQQQPHTNSEQFHQLQQQQQQQQRMMLQMMLKQQQQQQQSQMMTSSMDPQQAMSAMNANNMIANTQQPNKIQQHAQSQMNNLRQQAVVQHGQQDVNNKSPMTGQRVGQMVPQGPQGPPGSQVPQVQPSQQQINGINQFQSPQMINNSQAQGTFNTIQVSQQQVKTNNNNNNTPNNNNNNAPNNNNNNTNANNNPIVGQNGENPIIGLPSNNTNRNMNALQDYQKQLMLLEKQNKKRLDIARKNEGGNSTTIINNGMLPPSQGQQIIQQKPSPVGSLNSPLLNNKASPSSTGSKKKKDTSSKRGRKPSNPNINTANINGSNSSTNLKKEFSTPLTPASDNDSKRKRKSTTGTDSPKKQANKGSALGGTIKEKETTETTETTDSIVKDDIPPSDLIQDSVSQADQMFSVEILGNSSNDEQNFFNPNGQGSGGLDDIEFDFKQFLDNSGDSRLNEGMGSFNWGSVDAIEKND